MRYAFLLFACIGILSMALAQQPGSESRFVYSNVARNQLGLPITIRVIAVQLSIVKTSPAGEMVYSENHFISTNFFGVYDLIVGSGEVKSGVFEHISWGTDNYYLKVGIDTAGGAEFITTGPLQLIQVPEKMYVNHSEYHNKFKTSHGPAHYIGEQFGGGIVFNAWKDSMGTEHGLVVALNDQSDNMPWSNLDTTVIGMACQSNWNGAANTGKIIAQAGHSSGAALACQKYDGGGFHDWYLPSTMELNLLFSNNDKVKMALSKAGKEIGLYNYWSSTEYDAGSAWIFATYGGPTNNYIYSKYSLLNVRAVRAF